MFRILGVLAVFSAIVYGVLPARAAGPAGGPNTHVGGFVPARHGNEAPQGAAASGAYPATYGYGKLRYHNGPVQTGTHHTYAIFWGGSSGTDWTTNTNGGSYQNQIAGYFQNVAADSGKSSNVYYNDTQYYQKTSTATTYIAYSEAYSGSWSDTSLPASGCSDTSGGSVCLTDAQLQGEVLNAIHANGWPEGLGNQYFVFLANGISTCSGSQCAFSYFCAYHGSFTDSATGNTVLYANMPYTGHNLSACGGGNYPNGNPAADATLNVTSHEANETITDPLGTSWYDLFGYEIGDKCAWGFGNPLGGTSGAYYNQVINGAHYELQTEFSNRSNGCVLTGT